MHWYCGKSNSVWSSRVLKRTLKRVGWRPSSTNPLFPPYWCCKTQNVKCRLFFSLILLADIVRVSISTWSLNGHKTGLSSVTSCWETHATWQESSCCSHSFVLIFKLPLRFEPSDILLPRFLFSRLFSPPASRTPPILPRQLWIVCAGHNTILFMSEEIEYWRSNLGFLLLCGSFYSILSIFLFPFYEHVL